MTKKHKNVRRAFSYFEHCFFLISAVRGCVSVSAFISLVDDSVGIVGSTVGIKICGITAGIKNYWSIIKKNRGMIK